MHDVGVGMGSKARNRLNLYRTRCVERSHLDLKIASSSYSMFVRPCRSIHASFCSTILFFLVLMALHKTDDTHGVLSITYFVTNTFCSFILHYLLLRCNYHIKFFLPVRSCDVFHFPGVVGYLQGSMIACIVGTTFCLLVPVIVVAY